MYSTTSRLILSLTIAVAASALSVPAAHALETTSGIKGQEASVLQDSPRRRVKFRAGGAGYFTTGMFMPNLDQVNADLAINGYAEVGKVAVFTGGGGHSWIGDLLVGGFGGGFGIPDGKNNTKITEMGGGFGMGVIGYNVLPLTTMNLYPMLGIGGGGLGLTIRDKTSEKYSELMTDSRQRASVGTGGWLGMAGIGYDWLFVGEINDTQQEGFMIGLRTGYLYSFKTKNGDAWHLGEDGPSSGLDGFFVMLTVGGGGWARPQSPKVD